MPSANKMTTPVVVDLPEVQGRYAELDSYTVGFESYLDDVDPALLFQDLPDDRCQCPHWGVVQTGQITFRWVDHEETYGAGDAYYAGPGHLPLIAAGTSLVEFSPSDRLQQTMAVIEANLASAGDARSGTKYLLLSSRLFTPQNEWLPCATGSRRLLSSNNTDPVFRRKEQA